jgi:hypothetical protein
MMPMTYRLVNSKGDWLADAHSIGYRKALVANLGPGRYSIDEIRDESGPSGHTSRRWGVLLKLEHGTILTEPDPWVA